MEYNLSKTYDPKSFEKRIYDMWESSGAFKASEDKRKEAFTIVMPPPNITGQLHMGHALDHTLQDVLIRYKRMQGYNTLWLPGSDHASIATEVKVVDKIREEEHIEKEELGRDEFLKRAWAWKEEYGGRITQQCRRLGDSCDWSRERFTMDEGCNKAVKHFFVELYNKGLIYRGNRLINWCPQCGTSLSDAEVEHVDRGGKYWYFRYPAAKEGETDITVATSRPETMFGDVAIAVNPEDERYKDAIGQTVLLPLVNREIPVIADPYPDPEKGTGAVKITPAHDPNDFEVGERAKLEMIECMDSKACMTEIAGKYAGMDRYECRKQWVKDLEEAGFLVRTEEIKIPVGECYRCHTPIEPMLSEQWFVKMDGLAKPAVDALKSSELKLVPDRFDKIYMHWLDEIRDWCISRQLWWGHRIPAWYCDDCGEMIVSEEDVCTCPQCGSHKLVQDEDVLDTWFSSALWPFSTLGWPEKTEDLKMFYPTSVLVTGYDIIFFWVIRMVFSACEAMGKSPFEYVYLHGLVRDAEGRKMSKSLGNGIDPLEKINEFGADALRFMLSTGITPGNDMRFKDDRLESARNFANKLWNASRFVIMNIKDEDGSFLPLADLDKAELKDEEKWLIDKLAETTCYVNKAFDRFDLALAGQRIYELIWSEFCDWYIELVKRRLWADDEDDKMIVRATLVKAMKDMLKLLHPFMPFITEEIWGYLPHSDDELNADGKSMLISASWPNEDKTKFSDASARLELAMEAIRAIRNIRVEVDAPPSRKLTAVMVAEAEALKSIKSCERYVKELANLTEIAFVSNKNDVPNDVMSAIITGVEILIPMADLIDYSIEAERLQKELKRLEGEVKRASSKLSNEGFVAKAPVALIESEKRKLKDYEQQLRKVKSNLEIAKSNLK